MIRLQKLVFALNEETRRQFLCRACGYQTIMEFLRIREVGQHA